MGKDLEQTFPLSVSLSWSTDLGSRSVAPLSRSQKGRVVRSQSLARDEIPKTCAPSLWKKRGRKLIKINDNKEVQETAC